MGLSDRGVLFLSAALAVLVGCGDPAGPPVVLIEPPSGLTATGLPSGDIALSWQHSSDNETGFEVGRSTTGADGTYATLASLAADVSTYQDSQVDGVTQYCYRVRAVGAAGTTPSAFTTPACHQATAPTAPSALAATAGFGQVDLSWTDNSDDEAAFEVWSSTGGAGGSFALEASVAAGVVSYNSVGRADGTQYCYQVRALGAKGQPSGFSNTACATTLVPASPPPGTPTNLTAVVSGSTAIALAWTDKASDEAGFELWRSTTGPSGVYAPIDTVGANVTDASDAGLGAGAQYCYEVRALGGGTAPPSGFSNSACATAPAPPAAPSGLAATPTASTAVGLGWTDNSPDEQGFEIWRSTTGPTGTFSALGSVAADVTALADAGLTAGDEYCYQVRASGAGFAPASAFSAVACATPPTPPGAPSGLVATAASATAIDLTWTDNSPDEQGFEIRRAPTANGTYTIIDTVATNAAGATDAGLTPSTQFCYRVRALGAGVASPSPLSNSDCATTPTAPPATPSALAAVAATPSRINVTWQDDATDEAGIEVWRSTTGLSGTYTLRSARPANSVAYNDTGLGSATTYCYQVKATGAGSAPDSPFTGPVCATTPLVVRIVLFGDSNTDRCEDHVAGSDPLRFGSYVSVKPALSPTAQHLSCSVAAKVVASWNGLRAESVLVVNHAIASTTTGGLGGAGDPFRSGQTAPNARTSVGGITRFEAEVLGQGMPTWSGGETNVTWFPNGAVSRVNAYVPKANDFAYVSMGTNDDAGATRFLTAQATADNLRWMIQTWLDAGHRADHFILTTLAPRDDANSPTSIPARNVLIQGLATELGVHLIDLAGHVSDDNGATWRDPSLNIGDGIHYTETVRGWLGDQVAVWMSAEAPPLP
jgi:hypothetical protein